MNILALDQARSGAWSVFRYETKELLCYGTFSFDARKYTYEEATMHIEEIVNAVITAWDIDAVFIEDINLRVNVNAFKRLAQLQGVLANLFEKNKLLYEYVAPARWQAYCKASGRSTAEQKKGVSAREKGASKILSTQFVKDAYGIETDNDNLADAICIGHYAVNQIEIKKNEKKKSGKK